MGSHHLCDGGSLLGKFSEPLGLPWGRRPTHGEPPVHAGKGYRECPIHWVQFEQPFWIARTPVVNQHYEAHAPEHKRGKYSPGDRHPVVYVSWQDAKVFCEWLVSKSGYSIRLPSESEWECACRAGSNGEFCYGDEEGLLPAYAWFKANSASAQEVATRKPNAWRLFDLHGNVHEYCEDGWHRDYEGAPRDGSVWEGGDTTRRVVRGGSWGIPGRLSRSAHRAGFTVEGGICTLGFRPAFAVPAKSE